MSDLQDHIAQLKALLHNFQQEIAPYWDKESHKEKKAQPLNGRYYYSKALWPVTILVGFW